MRSRLALTAAVLVALAALVAGCGGDDEKAGPAPSTPSATLTGPGTVPSENFSLGDRFAEALAANTAESLAGAKDLVAKKSAAARYLATLADELEDGAAPLTQEKLSEGRYELCAGTDCTVLSNLVLADGKISSFKVDGKQVR